MPALESLGGVSKTVLLHTENHKTTFEAVASVALKQGQAVKLTATGQLAAWAKADGKYQLVGICFRDTASGELTTVWSRGYSIVYGLATAGGGIVAGPVTFEAYNTATNVGGTTGYPQYAVPTAASEEAQTIGWALDPAANNTTLIRVLLMD